ncbi:methyltransferase [Paraglaciecola aestuariivivens]
MYQPLAQQFSQLSAALTANQHYWRGVAFFDLNLPWLTQNKALATELFKLTWPQIDELANDDTALISFLNRYIADLDKIHQLSAVERFSSRHQITLSPRQLSGMPGRKQQQVQDFASKLSKPYQPTLEWCAGKSHLGFYLTRAFKQQLTALEWDSHLVEQANQYAKQNQLKLSSHLVDVMQSSAAEFLQTKQHVVALHACGELHEQLLHQVAKKQPANLSLAPCCYHKRSDDLYSPLSKLGRQHDLVLTKQGLHTAVMQTATAGATVQSQRKKLQIMRLGFDYLQREVRQSDTYLAVPSLSNQWAKASFADFCRHCAELKQLNLPKQLDWAHYLALAEKKFQQVSALDLVRFAFRRPTEVWLCLDRALYLQEHQYQVEIGTFCSPQHSPRNILIKAKR